jgi:hypothetical protein
LFYKNHGSRILVNLSESLDLTNVTRENIEVSTVLEIFENPSIAMLTVQSLSRPFTAQQL